MLPHHLRVLYLHGFASGPGSRKAAFFSEKLRELGFTVDIPDLAEGDFQGLTISRQLNLIERAVRHDPVIFIGSSLGGYLAALYAASHPEVRKLILLAPAFAFYQLWTRELGPERLDAWRKKGTLPILHYGEGREMLLGYQLMEDASAYPAFPEFGQPALIFHGTRDSVVPLQQSLTYAQSHPNVTVKSYDSGHELTDVLDAMWAEAEAFVLPKPVELRC
jgi:uncharacterized protein